MDPVYLKTIDALNNQINQIAPESTSSFSKFSPSSKKGEKLPLWIGGGAFFLSILLLVTIKPGFVTQINPQTKVETLNVKKIVIWSFVLALLSLGFYYIYSYRAGVRER